MFICTRTDSFVRVWRKLGPLTGVTIFHDNSGKDSSWFLDSVTINVMDKSYTFNCNNWLSRETKLSRKLVIGMFIYHG